MSEQLKPHAAWPFPTKAMAAEEEVIDVVCQVFPDGTSYWHEQGTQDIAKVVEAWKSRLPEEKRELYERCLGGVVFLRMPRSDYIHNIPATSQSASIFAAAHEPV